MKDTLRIRNKGETMNLYKLTVDKRVSVNMRKIYE